MLPLSDKRIFWDKLRPVGEGPVKQIKKKRKFKMDMMETKGIFQTKRKSVWKKKILRKI